MPIRGEGLMGNSKSADATTTDTGRTVYVLHPNCAVEEIETSR